MKTALITGITGQDGSFLENFYLTKGKVFIVTSVVHQLIIGNVLLI